MRGRAGEYCKCSMAQWHILLRMDSRKRLGAMSERGRKTRPAVLLTPRELRAYVQAIVRVVPRKSYFGRKWRKTSCT